MLAPTPAERARTLLSLSGVAVLATLDTDYSPFVAPVPFVADGAGHPVVVLSRLNPHTSRAWLDPRAGMAVADRLSVQGRLLAMNGSQQLAVQDRYLESHPGAYDKVESLDFAWFRLEVASARWIDDEGDDHWLTAEDLADAEADPLAPIAEGLVADLRDRLAEDLVTMAQTIGGQPYARAAALVGIDRYGLQLRVDNPGGFRTVRVSFPKRLDDRRQLHPTVGFLVRSLPIGEAEAGASERSRAAVPR
jgi:putative heme iron utilization protein